MIPAYPDSKQSFLDILVKLSTGELVNIEIQISYQSWYAKRCLYYWAHKYHSQLEAGKEYKTLNKVIGIHILTENYFTEYTQMHHEFAICHKGTGQQVKELGDLELHFIELAKFNNEWTLDSLSHWCLFLKEPTMVIDKLDIDNSIKKAYRELEKLSLDKDSRLIYEARLKELRDIQSSITSGFDKGLEIGMNEGMARGKAEGKAEGIQEASRILIKTMYQNGCSLEQIAQLTSISLEEIRKLLQ